MTSLSINLPDNLAQASQLAANDLGISRTQFIRQAIIHELENYRAEQEQKAMAQSMVAMKKNKKYLSEADELMNGLASNLEDEKEQWWNKK